MVVYVVCVLFVCVHTLVCVCVCVCRRMHVCMCSVYHCVVCLEHMCLCTVHTSPCEGRLVMMPCELLCVTMSSVVYMAGL